MMKKLFNSLSALATPVGCIIHVGAGQCSELQSYQDLEPQQIMLIEADTQQVMQLRSITQAQKNINVLACAVVDKKEQQTLKILSNQRDSSLLMPEKILEHYPSLAIVSEQEVTTETLNDLLRDYALDRDYHHLLILEVQGLEGLIIKSTSAEYLQKFSGIIIRSSAEKLYKQEQQENIIDLLESVGFEYSFQENEQYSTVFTKLYFQRNNEKIALSQCAQQINELTTSKAEQTKLINERQQQVAKLKEKRDAQAEAIAKKQPQIEQLQAAKEKQSKLMTERQQQVAYLTEKREAQAKAIANKQSQIEQLRTAKEEQIKLVQEGQQQVAKLTEGRNAQTKIIADKQIQIELLTTVKVEQTKLAKERQLRVDKLTKESDVRAKEVANKQSQIERLNIAKAEQVKLVIEEQQHAAKLIEECEAQAKIATEKQVQSNKVREQQGKLAQESQLQLQKLSQEFEAQVKRGQEQQAQLATLTQNIDQMKKNVTGLENELNSFRDKENKRLQELEEAKQTASLSVKLQMLKEGDLKDLQERYQLALITQENQHELLNKLSERLSLAAGYFHQISQEQQSEKGNKIAHKESNIRKGFAKFLNFKLVKRS